MIDFNHLYTAFDANLYWVGHKHTHIVDAGKTVLRLTPSGAIEAYRKRGVITGCYKKSFEVDDYTKPDADGFDQTYRPSYSEERFYGAQDQGYAELIIQPQHAGGIRDWLTVG